MSEANSPQAAREREVYRQISSITTLHAGSKCVRMLLDLFDITTATGNHICMVYRPLGLRISDFQALIPGGKLSQVILKLTLKHVLLALEFLHSVCHLAHTGKLPNYYSLFLSRVGLYLSLRVEVSDNFPDIQAKNILMDIDDENVLTEFEEAEVRDPSPCKVGRDRIIYTSRQMRLRGSAGRPVLCDFAEARIGDGKFTEDIQPFCTAHQRSYCESHGIKRWIFGIWEYW